MKTTKKHKTTQADFKTFKTECEYWVDKFNLREWKIYYKHEKSEKLPDTLAWLATNWMGRACSIGLNPNWGEHDIVSAFEVCRCAFHEVSELLLANTVSIAQIDICPTQKDELEATVHAVIRRMEWAIWQPDYEWRNS